MRTTTPSRRSPNTSWPSDAEGGGVAAAVVAVRVADAECGAPTPRPSSGSATAAARRRAIRARASQPAAAAAPRRSAGAPATPPAASRRRRWSAARRRPRLGRAVERGSAGARGAPASPALNEAEQAGHRRDGSEPGRPLRPRPVRPAPRGQGRPERGGRRKPAEAAWRVAKRSGEGGEGSGEKAKPAAAAAASPPQRGESGGPVEPPKVPSRPRQEARPGPSQDGGRRRGRGDRRGRASRPASRRRLAGSSSPERPPAAPAMKNAATRGQPRALAEVDSMILGRAPHAVLFVGPGSVGKTTLALDLAAGTAVQRPGSGARPCRACRGCRQVASGNHPDLHRLAPEGPGSQIRIGKASDPEPGTVRHLIGELALLPVEGGARVVIVEQAHRLNDDAQNAAPQDARGAAGRGHDRALRRRRGMPAADRSIALRPSSVGRGRRREIERWLGELGAADAPRAARLARLAEGRPGLALAYARSADAERLRGEIARGVLDMLASGRQARLAAVRPGIPAGAATRGPGPGDRRVGARRLAAIHRPLGQLLDRVLRTPRRLMAVYGRARKLPPSIETKVPV
jgi:hypothetical protein